MLKIVLLIEEMMLIIEEIIKEIILIIILINIIYFNVNNILYFTVNNNVNNKYPHSNTQLTFPCQHHQQFSNNPSPKYFHSIYTDA